MISDENMQANMQGDVSPSMSEPVDGPSGAAATPPRKLTLAEVYSESARRVAEFEARERLADELDTARFLDALQARAEREVARWSALPCLGELERLPSCSEAIAATCVERQHRMCPRNQLARAVEEQRERRAADRRRFAASGMPERALRVVFDTAPLETEAVVSLRELLARERPPCIVVLQGGVGCGKTCAAAWWAITTGAQWVSASAIARISPYARDATALTEAPRLVVDDLGNEYLDPKGFLLAQLDALVDARYAAERPTVITTNVGPVAFRERYGARIVDRIREAGAFIEVGGISLRRRRR